MRGEHWIRPPRSLGTPSRMISVAPDWPPRPAAGPEAHSMPRANALASNRQTGSAASAPRFLEAPRNLYEGFDIVLVHIVELVERVVSAAKRQKCRRCRRKGFAGRARAACDPLWLWNFWDTRRVGVGVSR